VPVSDALVSVVVPAYNAAPTLRACLDGLLRQELGEACEIILVDDGSTDATPEIAASYGPRVRVVRQVHRGAAAARNSGIRAASGDIVLFTDADCEPAPGWAATLVRAIRAGADGAKGVYRSRQRGIVSRFVQAEYESKYRRLAKFSRIDFIDTYAAAYRRDVLLAAGGFDESLPINEDQELSFRLAEQGCDLRFAPQAVVYHTHAATQRDYVRKKFLIGYWKVLVVRLHPARLSGDSHTPPGMRVQMALVAIAAMAVPASLAGAFSSLARRALPACAAAFLATTLPLAWSLWRRDPALALATPWMMLLRSAGLTAGAALGALRFLRLDGRMAGRPEGSTPSNR
jgi:glycosyltransferase involved in cell wall biosynthesis